jgi:voltage-gated potassium channel
MFYSVEPIRKEYGDILDGIRNIVMPIFILEYIGRLYASGYLDEYKGVKGKLKYMLTPYAVIDLVSILPYILASTGINSSFVRSLRLLRIFRLFRVKKYAIFVQLMKQILNNIKEELIVFLFYTVVVIVVLSFVIYDLEHEAQPEVFSNIFQTLWWAVATLTTVGYGDMYPVTAAGKFITAVITIIGIGFIAIPGGMFASEFMNAIAKEREKKNYKLKCYKCGSEEVQSFSNPIVKYNSQSQLYKKLFICKQCGFSWLDISNRKISKKG